jgi:hypothetical protein
MVDRAAGGPGARRTLSLVRMMRRWRRRRGSTISYQTDPAGTAALIAEGERWDRTARAITILLVSALATETAA